MCVLAGPIDPPDSPQALWSPGSACCRRVPSSCDGARPGKGACTCQHPSPTSASQIFVHVLACPKSYCGCARGLHDPRGHSAIDLDNEESGRHKWCFLCGCASCGPATADVREGRRDAPRCLEDPQCAGEEGPRQPMQHLALERIDMPARNRSPCARESDARVINVTQAKGRKEKAPRPP